MIGRTLTRTEIQLFAYCDNERQAIELAKQITLPDDATFEEIENAVAFALVRTKESLHGHTDVEYIGGERRDLRRLQ
jgi:hypothetical protein